MKIPKIPKSLLVVLAQVAVLTLILLFNAFDAKLRSEAVEDVVVENVPHLSDVPPTTPPEHPPTAIPTETVPPQDVKKSDSARAVNCPVPDKVVIMPSSVTGSFFMAQSAGTYLVEDSLTVEKNGVLIMQPCTVLKLVNGAKFTVLGSLRALGTADQPVNIVAGDDRIGGPLRRNWGRWESISFDAGSRGEFRHANIHDATTAIDNRGGKVSVESVHFSTNNIDVSQKSGGISIVNSSFTWARGVDFFGGDFKLTGNTFTSGTGVHNFTSEPIDVRENWWGNEQGPAIPGTRPDYYAGSIHGRAKYMPWYKQDPKTTDSPELSKVVGDGKQKVVGFGNQDHIKVAMRWAPEDGVYLIATHLSFEDGGSLTIEPGTVVKFAQPYAALNIGAGGELHVKGEAGRYVVLTSVRDKVGDDGGALESFRTPKPGDWRRIVVEEGGMADISHALIRYGGGRMEYELEQPATQMQAQGKVTIRDSIFADGAGAGLLVEKTGVTVSGTEFTRNQDGVIVVNGGGTFSGCAFVGNRARAISADKDSEVVADNNWWSTRSNASLTTSTVQISKSLSQSPFPLHADGFASSMLISSK